MQRVIYASRATTRMSSTALMLMLAACRVRNEADGLTGLLLYSDESFLQVLEGDPEVVEATWERIQRDSRHHELRLLAQEPIRSRSFPDWSMGFEHPNAEELLRLLPGFTPATVRPLVSSELVPDALVAETLLVLYSLNNR